MLRAKKELSSIEIVMPFGLLKETIACIICIVGVLVATWMHG